MREKQPKIETEKEESHLVMWVELINSSGLNERIVSDITELSTLSVAGKDPSGVEVSRELDFLRKFREYLMLWFQKVLDWDTRHKRIKSSGGRNPIQLDEMETTLANLYTEIRHDAAESGF